MDISHTHTHISYNGYKNSPKEPLNVLGLSFQYLYIK